MGITGQTVAITGAACIIAMAAVHGFRQLRRLSAPVTRLLLRIDPTGRAIVGDRPIAPYDPASSRQAWKDDPVGAVQGFTFLVAVAGIIVVVAAR